MANFKKLINKVRTAIYGLEVREAIANALDQTYIDAIAAGNTNMEVVEARDGHNTLLENINSIKIQQSQSKNYDSIELNDPDIIISLQNKKFYICTNKINSLSITEQINDINFDTRLYFEADSDFTIENIKFSGEHTDGGKLQVKKGYIYIINFMYPGIGLVHTINVNEGDVSDEPIIEELHDFIEGSELVAIAKTYFDARDKYMRYGQTNICSNYGNTSWADATTEGADSPDGRYRKLDCSGLVQLATAGITFNEVFKDKTTYNNRDLSARVESYPWAVKLPRTAANQCKYLEQIGWALPAEDWHTETTEWGGLKAGDLIFFGNSDNGRYKGVYHVAIYYGEYTASTGESKLCVIDCSSNSGISRHSDDITKGIRIIQFSKMDRNNIVTVARNQNGAVV